MTQYQTLIMYPMSATALILGKRLLHEGHSLSLFCPTQVTKRLADTIAADLEVEALDLASDVEEIGTLDNLQEYNFVIFPTLDLDPHEPRSNYASMCADLFRYILQLGIHNYNYNVKENLLDLETSWD